MKSIYISVIILTLHSSCNDLNKNSNEPEPIVDNTRTTIDWAGTYEGLLPCSDCEGIKTVVSLNENQTYVITEVYKGKSDSIYKTNGTFKWDEKGNTIRFSDKTRRAYAVGENSLTHLDNEENKISGEVAERYVLKKKVEVLEGKKWHLVSAEANEIQLKEAKAEHPFLQFKDDGTIVGFSGCNNLSGTYKVTYPHNIAFSKIVSTRMFCPEMETENKFLTFLELAESYKLKDRALFFYDKDLKQLAEFKIAN